MLGEPLVGSDQEYDWLGPGIYFWESDPLRAWEWADEKVGRGKFENAFVVGAVIDLGNCLDLMTRESLELLKRTYQSLSEAYEIENKNMPFNRQAGIHDKDKLYRFLDCAVINLFHETLEDENQEAIDTVRGLFTEGEDLYPGSGFKSKTHIQIAVRNEECIKGVFRVKRP